MWNISTHPFIHDVYNPLGKNRLTLYCYTYHSLLSLLAAHARCPPGRAASCGGRRGHTARRLCQVGAGYAQSGAAAAVVVGCSSSIMRQPTQRIANRGNSSCVLHQEQNDDRVISLCVFPRTCVESLCFSPSPIPCARVCCELNQKPESVDQMGAAAKAWQAIADAKVWRRIYLPTIPFHQSK